MSQMSSIITASRLSRRYGSRVGVEGLEFTVPEGSLFGFLGPNGAGKTTAIRILLGFLRPTEGTSRIFGRDCWRSSHIIKRDVGYLPGDVRLYPWMTVQSAIDIFGMVRGLDLKRSALELAERFQLEYSIVVRKMSRGMRQKLGLILALAHDPKLLVLDEPTTGLDPLMREELITYLRERAAQGRTVFFSSHTLREVEQLCDRVAILRDGRLVANSTLEALRRDARREATIQFADTESGRAVRPPEFLDIRQRNGPIWRCEFDGDARQLIQWAAAQPAVGDLTCGPPDLETVFRRYYQIETKDRGGEN